VPIIVDLCSPFVCNMPSRCPYCSGNSPKRYAAGERYAWDVERWVGGIRALLDPYGVARVTLGGGGDPGATPTTLQVLAELSGRAHTALITNGVAPAAVYAPLAGKLGRLSLSFHPCHWGACGMDRAAERFCERLVELLPIAASTVVTLVGYPGYFDQIERWCEAIERHAPVYVGHYVGEWGGKTYPQGYTQGDKERLWGNPARLQPGTDLTWLAADTRGKRCTAGHNYAMIDPDGFLWRCTIGAGQAQGNILDGSAHFTDRPTPCHVGHCNCAARWKFICPEEGTHA
jgi:hypothetical protein